MKLITVVSLSLGFWSNLGTQAPPDNITYLSFRNLPLDELNCPLGSFCVGFRDSLNN